ncbi:hypothetical protein KGF56_001357 [Candida oxycetoniae]|uniref:ferric-chelate reductase (NADPH) n=1 Tax=Candida oxycetoniae TaxID=497107 RepID=A0AAI9SZM5_9ASCO|nr:uncharacterized protein KGF56_001357 [Candida oxycetoniae]KAI3405750.2 hypothetical protein KGF56_001357 [Candida oxycetoniae]
MWSKSLFQLLLLVQIVPYVAAYGTPFAFKLSKRYYSGCSLQIKNEVTICSPRNSTCTCTNPNYLATLASCLEFAGGASKENIKPFIDSCKENNITLPSDWFANAILYYNENARSASTIPNFNQSKKIDYPFVLNKSMTPLYQESYRRFFGNYDHSLYYGAGLLGFWLAVMVLGGIANWSKILFPSFTKKLTSPVVNCWRKHVTMPATFGKKKMQDQTFLRYFGFLIPSRFESLVIALFYGATILCNAHNMEAIEGDPVFYFSKYKAELRYVADRTGITATMFMPLIFLFAGRNNFLQWLTRWNYSTFLAYHRHTSRVMFILIVIHAALFSYLAGEYYSSSVMKPYFYWGIIATIAGGLIMIQAMLFLRRRWYEIFLLLHIALAVLWVVGAWYHLVEMGYIQMVYPAVAVWAIDRVVRVARLVSFGFPNADVTLLSDETLKVVIPKPSYWRSIPGGHAFIHFLKPTYFWQSHPFTFTDAVDKKDCIVLFCKVKGGITHSLYQLLVTAPGRTCKIRVGVEGPYGEATPARYADTAVFIAGGNGIPGIYSEIMDIDKRSTQKERRSLKLIWVVREWRSLYWFYEELMSLKNTSIETTIYVTQPSCHDYVENFAYKLTAMDEISEKSADCCEKQSSIKEVTKLEESSCEEKSNKHSIIESTKRELSHISFKEGRPDIAEIVPQEICESNGSVAFVTCGHSVMVDQIRYYCSENVDNKERKRVDFYEQVQVWA